MDSKKPRPTFMREQRPDSQPQAGLQSLRTKHYPKHWLEVSEMVLPKSTYTYTPLGRNDIRLLHLFPADNKNDMILSALKVASIYDSDLQYQALSYTWGHEDATEPLWIQTGGQQAPRQPSEPSGQPSAKTLKSKSQTAAWSTARHERERNKTFYVRPNLSDALRHLRSYSGSSPQQSGERPQTLVIWIDYICINQEDNDEKSAQARMMEKIYKRAESVLIWLGGESEESNMAMDFILRIRDREYQGMLSVRGADAPQWRAFVALIRRAWFSRRWVVQELVFANQAYLMCGDVTVDWLDLVFAVEFFVDRFDTTSPDSNGEAWLNRNFETIGDINASAALKMVTITKNLFQNSRERTGRLKTLEALVSELKMFEVGDPRDSIYAVMALARDIEEPAPRQRRFWTPAGPSRPSFRIDYQRNILQVLTDFVAFSIDRSNSLDIICRKWAPNRRAKVSRVADRARYREGWSLLEEIHLPSWIGLLKDSAYGIPHVGPQVRVAGNSLVDTAPSRPYYACGPKNPEVLFGTVNSDRSQGERCGVCSTKYHDVDIRRR